MRKLWRLFCQYQASDLKAAVAKAHEHRLFDVNRIETILLQDAAQKDYQLPLEKGKATGVKKERLKDGF